MSGQILFFQAKQREKRPKSRNLALKRPIWQPWLQLEEASRVKYSKLEEESQPVRILFQQDFIQEEEEELEDMPDLMENLSLTKDVATSTDAFDHLSNTPTMKLLKIIFVVMMTK